MAGVMLRTHTCAGWFGKAPHVYTVDQTWYAGASWSRPVFDMQQQQIVDNRPVYFLSVSNIVFDNIEIKNQRIWGTNAYSWGGITVNSSHNITVSNCYLHSWYIAEPTVTPDHQFGGLWLKLSTGCILENCIVRGDIEPYTGRYSGTGITSENAIVRNCEAYNVPNGFLGRGVIRDCEIHHVYTSYDAGSNVITPPNGRHANGVYLMGTAEFSGNYVHDILAPGAPIVFPAAGWGGMNGTTLLYNNIISGNIHLNGDFLTPGNDASYLIFNNLIYSNGSNSSILASKKNDNAMGHVHIKNNILITTGSYPNPVNLAHPVADLQIDNNVYYDSPLGNLVDGQPCVLNLNWLPPRRYNLAGSQALGYNLHSLVSPIELDINYRPSDTNDPGVDIGLDLSSYFTDDKDGIIRPQGATWDIGPYEFGKLLGDANGDGHVNLNDFIILKQNYGLISGTSWSQGDFNGDGHVNLDDFIILKQNYGR